MHKMILKMFSLLKNLVKFFEIIIVFYAGLFVLYWAQNLIGTTWYWMSFSFGIFDSVLALSKLILSQVVSNLASVPMLKYIVALLFFIFVYYINKRVYDFVLCLEDMYTNLRQKVKKIEENQFNKNLMKEQKNEQEKIKSFAVYVKISVNSRKILGEKVDLEEQNKIMNKFLIEKVGVLPEVFEGGYLYKFNNFSIIDEKLDVFFKLIESSTPLDYLIVVQAYQNNIKQAFGDLRRLISIDIKNKICMDSETAYRYSFNKDKKFDTVQCGVYQRGENSIEVVSFEKKYL